MTRPSRRQMFATAAGAGFAAAAGLAATAVQAAPAAGGKTKAVFQVSDAEPGKWNLTLNNVRNAAADLGSAGCELEVVAFGPGVELLKAGSPIAARIAQARQAGVAIVACENTMRALQLAAADMLPELGFVPSGVVELMQKQREGWAYIRA
ncbi:MAG: DsrE family protein [Burkholderiales bacterium]|nr:DsrE family protein [Burkholderiales bacterium]